MQLNLSKHVNRILHSKTAVFNSFAGLASIISVVGWAGEKYLKLAPDYMGMMSFSVIGLFFLFWVYFLIASYIANER